MEFVPLWTDILDAPNWKILDLPPELFRFWAFCLMAAQKHDFVDGFLPEERTLSRWFGMPVTDALHLRDRLVTGGLIDAVTTETGTEYKMHDWQEWRVSKDRTAVKRQREKRAKDKVLKATVTPSSRNGHGDVTATSQDVTPQHSAFSIHHSSPPYPPEGEADEVVEFGRITMGDRFDLEELGLKLPGWRAAKYPDGWIRDAILVAYCNATPGFTASYIVTCLRRWKARGGPDPAELVKAQAKRSEPLPDYVQLPADDSWKGPQYRKGQA